MHAVHQCVRDHTDRVLLSLSDILGGDALYMRRPDALILLDPIHRARVLLARQQALTPTNSAGLGYPNLLLLHPAAFCASWVQTLKFALRGPGRMFPLIHSLVEGLTLSTSTC